MFNRNDLINIQNLLKRATFTGLEEAQVAVVLNNKIVTQLNKLFVEEANGRNVQNNDQPSPASSLGG